MAIRVLVSGAGGKMGREVVRAVSGAEGMEVVAAVDPGFAGRALADLCGLPALAIAVDSTLDDAMRAAPEVMVDFTAPAAAMGNLSAALRGGLHVVWGTTGLRQEDLDEIGRIADAHGVGAFHAPNFAIGAVLLMLFCRTAARYMPAVEILEMHGEAKRDAPSGTALRTAEMILDAVSLPERPETERFLAEGARGAAVGPIQIHSLRLPGAVAHQEVIFGSLAQTLTLRHDSMGRESFMPGVLLAIQRVRGLKGLVVGLEKLLDLA